MRLGVEPGARGSIERVGQEKRAGIVFAAVDAVGVGGDRCNASPSVERHGEAQQELCIAPAAPVAAYRDSCLSPRDQCAGRLNRLSEAGDLFGDAGMDEADIAGLALDRIAEDDRPEAGGSRHLRRRLQSVLRGRNHSVADLVKARIARLWRLRG